MADENGKVLIELDLDTGSLVTKLNGAEQSVKAFAGNSEKGVHGLGTKFLELNAIIELGIKAYEVAHAVFHKVIHESIDAAIENEHAVTQMNLALINSGLYSDEASEKMRGLAESLSKTSTFSGEAIYQAETLALKFAKTQEQAEKLTRAAVDMAAATGTDVNTAIQKLGLSLHGMTAGLGKLSPELRLLTQSQLENGAAVDIIAAKYSGSASVMTQTFGGRVQVLKNSFNELHETIGKTITQSPVVNRAIEGITKIIGELTHKIESWGAAGGMNKILNGLMQFSTSISTYVVRPLEFVYNVGKMTFSLLVASINSVLVVIAQVGKAIADFMIKPLFDLMSMAGKVISFVNEEFGQKITNSLQSVGNGIKQFADTSAESTVEVYKKSAAEMGEAMRGVFSTPISDQLNMKIGEIQDFFEGAKAPITEFSNLVKEKVEIPLIGVGDAFAMTFAGMKSSAGDMVKNLSKSMEQAGKSMMTGLGQGAGQAFAAFGRAVAQGKNGLEAFGKALFQAMGNMAIQLGTEFIMLGTASMFAPMVAMAMGVTNPVGLIATGAALAAFGGLISGMSGGAETAATGYSGGGASGGGVSGGGYEPTGVAEPAVKKQASIVINGDFLNSRETANHLQEIIRQNSDITDYSITAQGRSYA